MIPIAPVMPAHVPALPRGGVLLSPGSGTAGYWRGTPAFHGGCCTKGAVCPRGQAAPWAGPGRAWLPAGDLSVRRWCRTDDQRELERRVVAGTRSVRDRCHSLRGECPLGRGCRRAELQRRRVRRARPTRSESVDSLYEHDGQPPRPVSPLRREDPGARCRRRRRRPFPPTGPDANARARRPHDVRGRRAVDGDGERRPGWLLPVRAA